MTAPQESNPSRRALLPKPSRTPQVLARYGVALLAPAVALAWTFAAGDLIERAPLIFLFPAVVVAGWYGGRGPGFAAAVLSLLAAEFFLFPPAGSLRVHHDDLLALAAFGMVAGLMSLLTGWLREARGQAEERGLGVADLADRLAGQSAEAELRAETVRTLAARLLEAQEVAHVGSWQWDFAADRVSWTDELYRIHDLGPGETAITYEGFLERVHTDDRDRVRAVLERAYREHTRRCPTRWAFDGSSTCPPAPPPTAAPSSPFHLSSFSKPSRA